MHPAAILFSYTGFIFSGGVLGWAVGGQLTALIAATILSIPLLGCGRLCLVHPRRARLRHLGLSLGFACCALITAVYAWRAYLAFVEQSHVAKGVTITIMACAGMTACVLLVHNRGFGRAASTSIAEGDLQNP